MSTREHSRQWRTAHPEKNREVSRRMTARYRERLRAAVFGHYGSSCACCGATDSLTIDHVEGGGQAHRAQIGVKTGAPFYRWLVRNGFPDGYQTLCMSCNLSKHNRDRCRLDHAVYVTERPGELPQLRQRCRS